MKIAVLRETREGEARVALVPGLVGKLRTLGYDVTVEPDAGLGAGHDDDAYVAAGALVSRDAVVGADLVVSVQPPTNALGRLAAGTATLSFLPPNQSLDLIATLATAGVTSFAMELVPRISRA